MQEKEHSENTENDLKQFETVKDQSNNGSIKDPYESFHSAYQKKSKIIAGLFAFFIPGAGHFYLGLMEKGLLMILLIIFDIVGIVYFSLSSSFSIPLIVLLSLFLPAIYFYNIFDAIQSTNRVNAERMDSRIDEEHNRFRKNSLSRRGNLGWFLVGGGIIIFVISNKPAWITSMIGWLGSYFGAMILIAAGVILFVREARKK